MHGVVLGTKLGAVRLAFLVTTLAAGALVASPASLAATTTTTSTTTTTNATTTTTVPTGGRVNANAAPAGLPLYQFVDSQSGPLPWNALSFENRIDHTTMLGGPHAVSDTTLSALAYRTATSDVALYTQPSNGPGTWSDLTPLADAPPPSADPIPFIDPFGTVDVLYVSSTGDLILLSDNNPLTSLWLHTHHDGPWLPLVATDLSEITGIAAVQGLPSIGVTGTNALVTVRTRTGHILVFPLSWTTGQPVPYVSGAVTDLSQVTHSGVATSDPVVLADTPSSIATISARGHLEVYSTVSLGSTPWTVQDLTAATAGPAVTGTVAAASNGTEEFIAALTANGEVELLSTGLDTFASPPTPTPTATSTTTPPGTAGSSPTTTAIAGATPWTALNVTTNTTAAPPLSGELYLNATPTQVTIAGAAAHWGDLFTLTSATGTYPWTSTDVSVTAGSTARTVGSVVTGLPVNGALSLFAAGISSPPLQGVGVYAIPSTKWTQAVKDGWPILSETGGLGTTSSPWVGFTSTTSVASSPDYLMGQSLYNAHQRATWLSFWTVSGPLSGEPRTAATYYLHGFSAGAWVASQIDQYRALGVGLKPDWVILDPEGYPDDHSGLDAPGGASPSTLRLYSSYWSAMLTGWAKGIASVDPSLNAGIYATQSEYRNYGLASQPLPVFEALAFGGGGPIPVPGASGNNIRGFIAFGAVCRPTSTLQSEEQTLLTSPWGGQFNTLQFNAGVYCPPVSP